MAYTALDPTSYLNANPDVLAAWQGLSAADKARFPTPESYAQYHYNTYGSTEGRDANPAATAATAQAATDLATATANRTASIASNRDIATRNANDEFTALGLDPTAYTDKFNQSLNDAVTGLGTSGDPSSLDGKSLADSIFNSAQSAARASNTKAVNGAIGTNYGNNLISSHLLDGTISDILNTQQSSAQDYLDRGLKRGIYNDVGYNAGEKALSNDYSTGASALSTLSSGVLDKYRTQANTVRDNAYSAASDYNLGTGTFNLDDYTNQGNDVLSSANQNASGDLRGAVGSTNYFDLSSLNNYAGQAQGATNLRDDDLQFALAQRRKNNSTSRGLGSVGAF